MAADDARNRTLSWATHAMQRRSIYSDTSGEVNTRMSADGVSRRLGANERMNPSPVPVRCRDVNPASSRDTPRRISILGATGSIGSSTLDIIGRDPDTYDVEVLTANANAEGLAAAARAHDAKLAVVADPNAYAALKAALSGTDIEVAAGADAVIEAAGRPVDWTMAAIVGIAGLAPTHAALASSDTVALANKECLVAAGQHFMGEAARHGTTLFPVDSEHSAAFQSIDTSPSGSISRIVLTASGGPFRTWSRDRIAAAGPEQALKHPNWSMGAKVTIDSATLMNKGLELIEAFHLFPITADQLGVIVHPQSIIHCLVHYCDGSVLAQLGMPDMRTPIAYSLAWPDRISTPVPALDLAQIAALTFEEADLERFPALGLAWDALRNGGGAPTVLNAANEVAVGAFLEKRIGMLDIAKCVDVCMTAMAAQYSAPDSVEDALALDQETRGRAVQVLAELA